MFTYLLANVSIELLVLGGITLVALIWFVGWVADMVLKDRGFGVIGNALIMIAGGVAGFFIKVVFVGPIMG